MAQYKMQERSLRIIKGFMAAIRPRGRRYWQRAAETLATEYTDRARKCGEYAQHCDLGMSYAAADEATGLRCAMRGWRDECSALCATIGIWQ